MTKPPPIPARLPSAPARVPMPKALGRAKGAVDSSFALVLATDLGLAMLDLLHLDVDALAFHLRVVRAVAGRRDDKCRHILQDARERINEEEVVDKGCNIVSLEGNADGSREKRLDLTSWCR